MAKAYHQNKTKKHGNSKYTIDDAKQWREMRKTMRLKEVASAAGINVNTILNIMEKYRV